MPAGPTDEDTVAFLTEYLNLALYIPFPEGGGKESWCSQCRNSYHMTMQAFRAPSQDSPAKKGIRGTEISCKKNKKNPLKGIFFFLTCESYSYLNLAAVMLKDSQTPGWEEASCPAKLNFYLFWFELLQGAHDVGGRWTIQPCCLKEKCLNKIIWSSILLLVVRSLLQSWTHTSFFTGAMSGDVSYLFKQVWQTEESC